MDEMKLLNSSLSLFFFCFTHRKYSFYTETVGVFNLRSGVISRHSGRPAERQKGAHLMGELNDLLLLKHSQKFIINGHSLKI